MKKTIKISLVIIGLLLSSFSTLIPVLATSTEYLYLTGTGDSMVPTIGEGNTVKVKICTDGDMIKAGFQNSSHPGDIIVYCAGAATAYIPQLTSMWICHRAVEKYMKNGVWCFKTQGDNNPEPDPWEVPEHYLLGIVVEIIHDGSMQNRNLDTVTDHVDTLTAIDNMLTAIMDFTVGFFIGIVLGLAAAKGRRKQAFFRYAFLL